MTANDSFKRLEAATDTTNRMFEQFRTQNSIYSAFDRTHNLIDEFNRTQSLYDEFRVRDIALDHFNQTQTALDQINRHFAYVDQSPWFSQLQLDSKRYNAMFHSFADVAQEQMASFSTAMRTADAVSAGYATAASIGMASPSGLEMFAAANQSLSSHFAHLGLGASAYASAISRASQFTGEIERLRKSVGMSVLHQLHEHNLTFDESVEIIKETVRTEIRSGQSSPISFAGWMNILMFVFTTVLTIYLHVDSQHRSTGSEERLVQESESVRAELVQKFDNLELALVDTFTYFVATNGLNVRSGPSTDDEVQTVIYPNQQLKLLDQKGRWLYVEYFDYLDETPRQGWVYKRYLKEITLAE